MIPEVIGAFGFLLLFLLLAAGVPIGVSMGISGFLGLLFLLPPKAVIAKMAIVPFELVSSYTFATLPLFFLMGQVIFATGQGGNFYEVSRKWFGRIKGGLAMATIAACAGFGAVTASSIACAVTIGQIAYSEMKKNNYDEKLIFGSIAAGGTLGSLIPPSGFLLIYGIITENSISKLFMGGILPGIICAFSYIFVIAIVSILNPKIAPPASRFKIWEKITSLKKVWELILLIIFCIGGLVVGIFTATEAGAVGALGAFLSAIMRKKLTLEIAKKALIDTMKSSGMIFSILIGAMIFNYFCAASNLPEHLANWIMGLELSPLGIIGIIIVVYLILGALMDEASIQLITLPIIYPVIIKLGFDPIWFGVMQARLLQIGMIIPPIAIIDFILAGMFKVPLTIIYKGVIPFLMIDMVTLTLFTVFPQIILWLPSIAK
uniref:TRAP transporter large permease subunit n=1 Tax=candidate division WOR-3 bacterium TaxID=2052148 RepID=A0A7C2K0T8_UNCW3